MQAMASPRTLFLPLIAICGFLFHTPLRPTSNAGSPVVQNQQTMGSSASINDLFASGHVERRHSQRSLLQTVPTAPEGPGRADSAGRVPMRRREGAGGYGPRGKKIRGGKSMGEEGREGKGSQVRMMQMKSTKANVTGLRIPTVYLVAAPKTGSTAFAELLYQHPKMCRPQTKQRGPLGKKETHFFSKSKLRARGLGHLSSLFQHDPKCRGSNLKEYTFLDATPDYMYGSGRVMQVMLPPSMHKQLKFLAVFREPIQRDVSWFNHARFNKDPEHYQFDTYDEWALTQLDIFASRQSGKRSAKTDGKKRPALKGSLFWGMYATNLERWWRTWGKSQTMVLNYETIVANTTDTMQRVAKFLGIDGAVWAQAALPTANERGYEHKVRLEDAKKATCEKLHAFFEPHNQKLYKLLDDASGMPPEQPPFPHFTYPCEGLSTEGRPPPAAAAAA